MSNEKISQSLEMALDTILPKLATAWENVSYAPVAGTPYQEVWCFFARPYCYGFKTELTRQAGYLQVALKYPVNTGRAAALARATLLQTSFFRGLSLIVGGVTTIIEEKPEIGQGSIQGDRYVINVFIRFYANLTEGT